MCLRTALTCIVVVSLLECPRPTNQLQSQPGRPIQFSLSVNESSKSITVYVEHGKKVKARWCHNTRPGFCTGPNATVNINSSLSQSAVLKVPYLLPCVCVEVWLSSEIDSERYYKCPLRNSTISDVKDVWNSIKTTTKTKGKPSLNMSFPCPASQIKVSADLCWKHGRHCTVVFNLSLVEQVKALKRIYNTSAVDRHPQMCVKRSFRGSHNITCHFEADMSTWSVHTALWRQSVFVYINSTIAAKFSVQLCKLSETKCTSMGQIHSLITAQKMATFEIPLSSLEDSPCVQVWQTEPALYGRRILCQDYTRGRGGIYAVAALVCVVVIIVLGICIHHLTKKGTAGWLLIEKPVLLVCSSEDSVHVSTVCALASILQRDLGATVHLALWAQSSQSQYGTGVADIGPLPWLYGQWETVIKAQGNVLIIWSPDAKVAYKKWWSEKEKSAKQKDFNCQRQTKHQKLQVDNTVKLKTWRTGKSKMKKVEQHKAQETDDLRALTEPCTVIAPVFKAALTCLMGALQENKGQQVAFVFLQGHGNSKDIPKAFRSVPRYCLPRQFSGLIQELSEITRLSNKSKLHCWTRLISKVLSFWLAKRLACRLQTLLPQTQTEKRISHCVI